MPKVHEALKSELQAALKAGARPTNPAEAKIVGRILLAGAAASDDTVTGNAGMGGQGILTIPVVYNGWVQNLPQNWACKLSGPQLNPIGVAGTPPACP